MTNEATSIPDLYQESADAVESAMKADGVNLTRDTAWNFVYRYALGMTADDLPHIVEENYLKGVGWKAKATTVRDWLASNLVPGSRLTVRELRDRLDSTWNIAKKKKNYREGARPNVAGLSLEYSLAHLIVKFCGVSPIVGASIRKFRGYELAQRAEVEELDLALFTFDDFRMLISCLWTTRKDRLASDLYEAAFLRRRRPDVAVIFVVNEFHPSILRHLLNAPEVDQVYHVGLSALLEAHKPFDLGDTFTGKELLGTKKPVSLYNTYLELRQRVRDLSSLFDDIDRLKPMAMTSGP
jgi:hypothetical protein